MYTREVTVEVVEIASALVWQLLYLDNKASKVQKSPGLGLGFQSRLADTNRTFGKHGPGFEQGWVECFIHVEPMWNSAASARFLLEFHIQTVQCFKVKLKQRGMEEEGETGHQMAHQVGIAVCCHKLSPSRIFDFASILMALLQVLVTNRHPACSPDFPC